MKKFLIIVLKIAVNALLVSAAFMAMLPGVFHMHTAAGWWNLLKLGGTVIAAREAIVWAPILMRWSSTDADPSSILRDKK